MSARDSRIAAAEWLRERHPGTPAILEERMRLALESLPAGPVRPIWQALAEAAHLRLRAAIPAADRRTGALDLLAGDALLTHACEAAAEAGPEALAAMTRDYGPGRLAELLDGADGLA